MVLVHGHIDGHVFKGFDLGVGQHFAVDDGLDLFEFLVGHLGEVGKVEAQARRDATAEPACLTCVPSTWRSAACSRCVPV